AQRFVEHDRSLFMAYAEDLLATRMYDSLAELGEGWTKNLAMGSRATVSGWLRPLLPWLLAALLLLLWVVPPYALLLGLLGVVTGTTLLWAAIATFASLVFWSVVHWQLEVPPRYAFLYPVGAIFAATLLMGSAIRGPRVSWRGRRYGAAR
ncbi:MAG: hypothetical protein ACRELV_08825, partial [Longimicrobiales bacterium]